MNQQAENCVMINPEVRKMQCFARPWECTMWCIVLLRARVSGDMGYLETTWEDLRADCPVRGRSARDMVRSAVRRWELAGLVTVEIVSPGIGRRRERIRLSFPARTGMYDLNGGAQ